MKRFHVHVSVANLDQSIRFYSTLFGSAPSVTKSDYAKWMLENPRINFAISQRSGKAGINHLGLQTDSDEELEALHGQLQQADVAAQAEKEANCCYSLSNKYWVTDPSGIAWETFHTLGSIPTFDGTEGAAAEPNTACCATSEPTRVDVKTPVRSTSACCR